MKLRTIIAVFAASVAVAAPAAAEEQVYYCTSELGTGIAKDEANGQWKTYGFQDIRFTMKLGDNTKGDTTGPHNRDLVLTRGGYETHFICDTHGPTELKCVSVMDFSIERFFADNSDPDESLGFWPGFLAISLSRRRFELYSGATFDGFANDGLRPSSMYAGTCETF
jgi:hypothetical protein